MKIKRIITSPECIAFIISLIIQILWNQFVPIMRSLPDEVGAISFAAYLNGMDWSNVLSNPSMYYGNGMFFLLYPFFLVIKDPFILYQCLLGVCAFLRATVAIISVYISKKYFYISNKYYLICIGLISSLFSPTRSTIVDNEALLIVLTWGVTLSLFKLIDSKNPKEKRNWTIFLSFLSSYAYIAHNRGILYIISIILVILIYYIYKKEWLIDLKWFFISIVICFIGANVYIKHIKNLIFYSEATITTRNTIGGVVSSVNSNISTLFTKVGLRSFLDLLCSNLWVTFVFSYGILYIGIFNLISYLIRLIKKIMLNDKSSDEINIVFLFSLFGVLISIIGLCISELHNGTTVHINGSNITRFHFYMRYYGNYFGPLILFVLCNLYKKKIKYHYFANLFICLSCIIYVYCSILYKVVVSNEHYIITDWFYFFAPFSLRFGYWPDVLQGRGYFIASSIISIIIFTLIVLLAKHGNKKILITLIACIVIWYNFYLTIFYDSPFSKSDNYLESVNGIAQYLKDHENITHKNIAYINNNFGNQYVVQFVSKTNRVTWYESFDSIKKNEMKNYDYILSNNSISELKKLKYKEIELDNNEYLYTLY
ncbi:hypothetical protein [uncultured Dubosiella sp.]|uniref:hypothetical protein n=1 Tax=uncultured Dubosiella sp. TaxID=1937011 RepID=UPI002608002D|nr:hypothetical protein [uncultured Dubosiella sp.]